MAGVTDEELTKLGPWPSGINNLAKLDAVPTDAVRAADNMDFNNVGQPATRAGAVKVISSSRSSSLWRAPQFPFALYLTNGTLTAITDQLLTYPVKTGLSPLNEVVYEIQGDIVYWSNNVTSGRISSSGIASPWGVQCPGGQPLLTAAVNGGLDAGNYMVAVTFLNVFGEESGSPNPAAQVVVSQGGSIAVSGIPQPDDGSAASIRLYRTGANDGNLKHAIDLPIGAQNAVLNNSQLGRPMAIPTLGLERVPPCYRIASLNGRLYFAYIDASTGSHVLGWTEPLRYGVHDPVNNRIGFPAPIDMIMGVGDGDDNGAGLYIGCGSNTYFFGGGDPKLFSRKPSYPYGVIPGTAIKVPATLFGTPDFAGEMPYWISANGFACTGDPGGLVRVIRENEAQAPLAAGGASMLREQNGLRHLVTSLSTPLGSGMQFGDRVITKLFRNGVQIS